MMKYNKIPAYLITCIIFSTLLINIVGILNCNLQAIDKAIELLLNVLFIGIILSIISVLNKIAKNIKETKCVFITVNGDKFIYFCYWFSILLVVLYSCIGIITMFLNLSYPVKYAFYYMLMMISCTLIIKVSIKGLIYSNNIEVYFGVTKVAKLTIREASIKKRKFDSGYDILIMGKDEIGYKTFANYKTKEYITLFFIEQGIPFS